MRKPTARHLENHPDPKRLVEAAMSRPPSSAMESKLLNGRFDRWGRDMDRKGYTPSHELARKHARIVMHDRPVSPPDRG